MPYLIIEHPAYVLDQLLSDRWRITCQYPNGEHCDIDVLDDNGEVVDLISETLLEGDYSYDYIYAHYKPHIQIGR